MKPKYCKMTVSYTHLMLERVPIHTNGAIATYDFSGDLRKFQWGVQAGVDWQAFKHLKVHADLNWGLNDIFNKDLSLIHI